MSGGSWVFQWLAPSGAAGLVTVATLYWTIKKMRAEAGKITVDAAIAEDTAEDAHWRIMIETQTSALIQPLALEVARQGDEIAQLRKELAEVREERDTERSRYRSAMGYIRVLYTWVLKNAGGTHPMDLPTPPSEIDPDFIR